jgi:hypothetical protein
MAAQQKWRISSQTAAKKGSDFGNSLALCRHSVSIVV